MSRVIKFRVWDGTEYHEVELSPLGGYGPLIDWDKSQAATDAGNGIVEVAAPDGHDSFIWEQFTGLLDRNGREIYEGDFVRLSPEFLAEPRGFHIGSEYAWVNQLESGEWYASTTHKGERGVTLSHICDDVEVAGNEHETPDLQEPHAT